MSIKLKGKQRLLLTFVLGLSFSCSGQKLFVGEYDTAYTKYSLKNKLLEVFNQKDDSADVSVMFFQLRRSSWIKSFYLHQKRNDCTIRFFTVDSIFSKKSNRLMESDSVQNIFTGCNKNKEISGERITNSTYSIIVCVKVGLVSCEIKTTNVAFFSETND